MKTQSNSFKKRIISSVLLAFAMVGIMSLVSCKFDQQTTYKVSYETEIGTAPDAIEVNAGTTLQAENLPELTAEGYCFAGWYVDGVKINPGEYKVTKNVTLKASW